MAKRFKLEDFLPYRLNILAQETSQELLAIYSADFGLDIPQWRILANLASRGDLTAQEISAITLSHKSTISRAVAALDARKLIERVEDTGDRRAFVLRLTAKGRKLFDGLLPRVLGFEKKLMSRLSANERKGLLKGLGALERELLLRDAP